MLPRREVPSSHGASPRPATVWCMVTGPVVSIRVLPDEDRIEVTLRPGFTRKELDVVRALPGRRYDPERRIWTAPNGRAAITTLTAALGAEVDPGRIRQVIGNLLDNAIRHTDRGGMVSVRLTEGGDHLEITVADTGAGIPAEHLPHVFDRFYRADVSRSRETGGSGLGLAIAAELVRLHGGSISVESEVGDGSVFRVRLPR